jgi:hypothetical protein
LGDLKSLMSAQDVSHLGAMIVNGHHLVLHVSLIRVLRNQNCYMA